MNRFGSNLNHRLYCYDIVLSSNIVKNELKREDTKMFLFWNDDPFLERWNDGLYSLLRCHWQESIGNKTRVIALIRGW